MGMENDVDAPDSIEWDCDVHMEWDGDDDEEDDEEEDDVEMEDEEEVEEEDEDEEEDQDEDDGKKPRAIVQGEMVNTSADDVSKPWYTISQSCYLSKASRCASIPYCHNLRRLPHSHKPRSLAHDNKLRRLIPSVGWRIWGLWSRNNLARHCQLCRSQVSCKHLGCGCWCGYGSAAADRIGTGRQSPRCPSPWYPTPLRPSLWCPFPRCHSPWGTPGWIGRRGGNQFSRCRGGDGFCFQVMVGFLSCSFALFQSIYLRNLLLHASQGFWIAHGLLSLWGLYWFYIDCL